MKGYADLADLPEDKRIEIIAATAARGEVVGFVVDDEPKADRYIMKLMKRFPACRIIDRRPGPVAGTVLVRVGPVES